ncbi:MAG: DUF58 domain-containing protein [Candidatus Bathyarchaeota archaeon]|nr:DUF58 domain-containing protein [Candidatus Bathyarchaeota archaeon]
MKPLTIKTVAKAYLIIVLLLAVLVSPLPQLGIAIVLLAVQVVLVYKPPRARVELVVVIGSLVFMPLALEAFLGEALSVLLMVPALLLLDQSLKDYSSTQRLAFVKTGRSPTAVLKALGAGLLLFFTASILVWNVTLIVTSAVLSGYLSFALAHIFVKIPKKPFEESKTWNRVVAGKTATNAVNVKINTGMPLFAALSSEKSWIHVEPSEFIFSGQDEIQMDLRFTPPLAGPSKLQVQAMTVDPRGLIQTAQILEPLELHIIPRAKYAQWLANKYLQQTSPGTGSSAAMPSAKSAITSKAGVEYYSSRQFQPGDRWKDLDWKHSYLFGELIVKEFSGAQGNTALLVADLTAKDAEEADMLAYNFVMAALTLATEAVPTALAAYNYKEVLATTFPINPREALKKTLELTEKIVFAEPSVKVLELPQLRRIKRSIDQLERTNSNASRKLIEILKLEVEANQMAASRHPSGQALAKMVDAVKPPATLTVIAAFNSGDEELTLTIEKLRDKGYNTILVGNN